VANAGAKNLLRNEKNAGATVERQGATWSFDQTSMEAVVSGTVGSTWSDVYLLDSNLDLSDKEYTVVVESDSPNLFIFISGNTLSGDNIPSNGQYYPGVYKYKGIMTTLTRFTARTASYSNNTIRCMICPASITDSTFQPYAKTNVELTGENASQQAEIDYAVNTGAKNLLDYTFSINGNTSARTSNGVTFTINADRSISTSGTASATITSAWVQQGYVVPSYPVILSGCPAGGADNKYRIDILDGIPTGSVVAFDYGNGTVIKSSMFTNGIGIIRIRIEKDQNVDGLVFKPMIRPAAITDSTFVPYALPNPVITPALIDQVDEGAKNKLHYDGISTPSGDTANISFSCSGDLITITGSTSSNAAWCYLTLSGSIITVNDFCNGKYFLSSERTGSGTADIFVYESSVG
jgi:hypothetical protein